jgi:hypothetical protein
VRGSLHIGGSPTVLRRHSREVAVRQWIRCHLTFANVVSLAALFVALGGTATAVSYVVSSNSQVGPGTISGHKPPSGKHANIIAGSINGTDIADRSGVDTCKTPLTKRFGPICVGSDGGSRKWLEALSYCSGFGLRLPTPGEAITLAKNYDVPGVATTGFFWTDNDQAINGLSYADAVSEAGDIALFPISDDRGTVCVTDPSA